MGNSERGFSLSLSVWCEWDGELCLCEGHISLCTWLPVWFGLTIFFIRCYKKAQRCQTFLKFNINNTPLPPPPISVCSNVPYVKSVQIVFKLRVINLYFGLACNASPFLFLSRICSLARSCGFFRYAPVVGCGQRSHSLVWVNFSQLLVNVFFPKVLFNIWCNYNRH